MPSKTLPSIKYVLFSLSLFAAITSCSKEDKEEEQVEEQAVTHKYFVKVKVDGVWQLHETPSESWCQTNAGLCYSNTQGADVNYTIDVGINDTAMFFSAEAIESLAGMTYSLNQEDNPYADVSWVNHGVLRSTLNTEDDQAEGYLVIDEVVPDGETFGFKCYLLKGRFAGVLGDDAFPVNDYQATEGTFAIRVSEQQE